MSDGIKFQVVGATELILRLNHMGGKIRAALKLQMLQSMIQLRTYVVRQKLSGQVLKVKSGTLRRSITQNVIDSGSAITGSVGTNIIYARIHEYGGQTKPHIIEAKNGKALRFMIGGKEIFRKSVHHPGSKIPERSFLRSSLAENSENIRKQLADAIVGAMNES